VEGTTLAQALIGEQGDTAEMSSPPTNSKS
jgi:hypothetical protein